MSAFSDAADAIFTDPNVGEDASYSPAAGGGPLDVRVVRRDPPDSFGGFDDTELLSANGVRFRIRASDVAAPKKGDSFTVGAVTYKVSADPAADKRGLVWDLSVVKG